VIELTSSRSSGVLTSPRYPKNHPKGQVCEWWIKAPEGWSIQVTITYLSLASQSYKWKNRRWGKKYYNKYCARGYVLVNKDGDSTYPIANSEKVCGYRAPGTKWISNGSNLNILFNGGSYKTKGINIKYSLI
ncbi:unnamed protein product, partial [Meganyctiphanes norvegica]